VAQEKKESPCSYCGQKNRYYVGGRDQRGKETKKGEGGPDVEGRDLLTRDQRLPQLREKKN